MLRVEARQGRASAGRVLQPPLRPQAVLMAGSVYGRGTRGKATRLHSLVVRARGRCERCGRQDRALQCAHIIPRRYAATRTDEHNAWALDAGCHLVTTEWALQHMALVEATIGMDAYDELVHRAEAGVKANEAFWQAEVDRLTLLLAEVSA